MKTSKNENKYPLRLFFLVLILFAATFPLLHCTSRQQDSSVKIQYRRARNWVAPKMKLSAAAAPSPSPCPAMTAKQLYRYIAGQDPCPIPLPSPEIAAELNDPYATSVLIPNVGGAGWPTDIAQIQQGIQQGASSLQQLSYLVGEGSQIPPSLTTFTLNGQKVIGNQDLRYVLTWGTSGSTPVIFLSALPTEVLFGTPPPFLQVISFDPQKKKYNYFQYVSTNDLGVGTDTTQTWSWAGDSSYARNPTTIGQGCFACHLNGGLNMKELTVPWNNWNAPGTTISTANIPPALAQDPIYKNLSGADTLQTNFQNAWFLQTTNWVSGSINNGTVSNVSELLRRLIETTTINFQASQIKSASQTDVTVPPDFFLNNSVFRGNTSMGYGSAINLNYSIPTLTISWANYNAFVQNHKFALVNQAKLDGPPDYSQPGATSFAFFIPGPAFEDLLAIKRLITQSIISTQFAGAVLMVDFQNPIFSPTRSSLMQYAQKISTGKNDGKDIPNQFVALVKAAVQGQTPCNPTQSSQCSAEWQFLFYWNQGSNWQTTAQTQIQHYLNSVGTRIATTAGANDYMTQSVSRGIQFSNYPLVCNLHEFTLLLPTTDLGNVFSQMNTDGTISSQPAYSCSSNPLGQQVSMR
jgi:hypothetical protein